MLQSSDPESLDYDLYRSACIKEYEIILEQSAKLLRKFMKRYAHSSRAVDQLTFKDLFRHAVLRGIIDDSTCERWFVYRDNRNTTVHDYGLEFAENTLKLLPGFLTDASGLLAAFELENNASEG